ncbi:type IX secretion system membrane protein PorP/SprF [Hyunsoonleella sp. 2307UL5-6]|uniref:PorP/SprF family type IX secretion system membrane protein n=1 Tax=Hyunsoonleella sp. 2307UL5-6 TaxID=3384768 RepID=UPI0039BC91C8
MKNLSNKIIVVLLLCLSFIAKAQQDAQYTQYMYNTMTINPAYAGTRDAFSFTGLYRTQWVGLEGAPKTATVSFSSPISERSGLGVNIIQDEIFISKETYIDIAYSYAIPVSYEGKLAFGIKGGAQLLDVDTNRLLQGAFDDTDVNAQIDINNRFSPQVGVGVYYYDTKFYVGVSAPNLLETEHYKLSGDSFSNSGLARERINYYAIAGYVFDIHYDWKFKPAALVKVVDGAPLQADVSANFIFRERLTLGAAYRWSAAFSALAGFQINDQLMLGFAYDVETTELQQYNNGSFEFLLRFELFNRKNKLLSPRFF